MTTMTTTSNAVSASGSEGVADHPDVSLAGRVASLLSSPRLLLVSISAMLAITLAACSSSDDGSAAAVPAGAATSGATSAAAEATPSLGEEYVAAVADILDRLATAASDVAAVMAQADISSDAWRQELAATLEPFAVPSLSHRVHG